MSKVKIVYSYLRHLVAGAYLTSIGLTNGNPFGFLHLTSHDWRLMVNAVWVAVVPQLRHAIAPILVKLAKFKWVENILVNVFLKKYPAYTDAITAIVNGIGVAVNTPDTVGPTPEIVVPATSVTGSPLVAQPTEVVTSTQPATPVTTN